MLGLGLHIKPRVSAADAPSTVIPNVFAVLNSGAFNEFDGNYTRSADFNGYPAWTSNDDLGDGFATVQIAAAGTVYALFYDGDLKATVPYNPNEIPQKTGWTEPFNDMVLIY